MNTESLTCEQVEQKIDDFINEGTAIPFEDPLVAEHQKACSKCNTKLENLERVIQLFPRQFDPSEIPVPLAYQKLLIEKRVNKLINIKQELLFLKISKLVGPTYKDGVHGAIAPEGVSADPESNIIKALEVIKELVVIADEIILGPAGVVDLTEIQDRLGEGFPEEGHLDEIPLLLRDLRMMRSIAPDHDAVIARYLGLCFEMAGLHDKAREMYIKAADLSKDKEKELYYLARNDLAVLYAECCKKYDEAYRIWQSILDENPKFIRATLNLMEYHLRIDPDETLFKRYYNEILKASEESPEKHILENFIYKNTNLCKLISQFGWAELPEKPA